MKILFINPWSVKPTKSRLINRLDRVNGDNLVCQILASVTPRNHSIEMINDVVQPIDFDADVDMVALTTLTRTAPRAYEIADEFRRRGKTVVLGGWHASALPQEAKQHADSVVIGEAEELWPRVLQDFEQKTLQSFYEQDRPADLDAVPILTREQREPFKLSSFFQSIEITKGCPTGCNFCSISYRKFGSLHRTRSIENAIKELEAIPQKFIVFSDPSLTINPKYTKQLFKAMKGLNKKFIGEGNANVLARDDELLKLAAEAGCIYWYVGFESVNQETVNSIGKTTNKVESYKKVIEKVHDYGMCLEAALMFGFDTDAPDVFENTLQAIQSWDIDLMDFSTLTPYPGTPLFSQLEEQGRILTREWQKYDSFQVVFQPKQMTPDQLLKGVQRMWEEFYTPLQCIKRSAKSIALGLYPFVLTTERNYNFYYNVKTMTASSHST
jgi:radical SAM superfamily enzyme YgiQ (UPF0313 family)